MENLEMNFLILLKGEGEEVMGEPQKVHYHHLFFFFFKNYIDSWGGVIQILNVSVENIRSTS